MKLKANRRVRRTSEGSREGKSWRTHQPTQPEGIFSSFFCRRFLACSNAWDEISVSYEPSRGGCTRCMCLSMHFSTSKIISTISSQVYTQLKLLSKHGGEMWTSRKYTCILNWCFDNRMTRYSLLWCNLSVIYDVCAPSRDVPAFRFAFQRFYSRAQMAASKPVYINKQTDRKIMFGVHPFVSIKQIHICIDIHHA